MNKSEKIDQDNTHIEEEINLYNYLIVLAKRKKFILSFTFSIALISMVYSLFLPIQFKSTIEVLLPAQQQGSSAFMQRISNVMGIQNNANNSNLYNPYVLQHILTSRTVLSRLINRFNLTKEAEKGDSEDDIMQSLANRIHTDIDNKSSITSITVIDSSPNRAADMANALVPLLEESIQEINQNQSSNSKQFLKKQLLEAKEALIVAEEQMRRFQESTGVLEASKQTTVLIDQIASLRREIIENDVQLSVMKTYSTQSNPDLQQIEETIKGLKKALNSIEKKESVNESTLPLSEFPSIGTDYIRKLRDLKFAETVYEVIAKQYETAKMTEAIDQQSIIVLQKAFPSKFRFKPSRRKIVMYATVIAFTISIFISFTLEFFSPVNISPRDQTHINTLKTYLSFRKH